MGEAKAIAAAAGGAGEAEAFLVHELEKIAGQKAIQDGGYMGPCRSLGCGHVDCRAARTLFRYRRLKSVESIGGGA